MTDWVAWHEPYDDPESPLSRRLAIVQVLLHEAIAGHAGDRLRILSLCSGDGRDVLPVAGRLRDRTVVSGRLIEAEPTLARQARARAALERLDGIEVVCGDAARTSNHRGAIPADLVVACGIFGNLSDEDVDRFIDALPLFCAENGSVVWTRHRRQPDRTPAIRDRFAAAGFDERAFVSPGPEQFSVGWHQRTAGPAEGDLPESLFAFVR
jgi:hypothetical protein